MALNAEALKANEALTGLTDEQITAIATLSTNDEVTVIGAKVGEIHGAYDKDVLEVTGMEKNQGEKSYDFVKRVLGSYKDKASNSEVLTKEVVGYKTKITSLETSIAEGTGDEVIKQQLKDSVGKLTALQGQFDSDKTSWETEKGEFATKLSGIQVSAVFDKATAGLKFKAGYPEAIQKTLIDAAKAGILATSKTDFIETTAGKVMIFRDEKGEIMRNPNNLQEPYTAAELIAKNLAEVLDTGKKTTGAGTGASGGDSAVIEIVDIAGAKTQVEADNIIVKYLLQQGELKGTASFSEKQSKIRIDNGVTKLPTR
jgi:hypothetical protein